MLEEKGDDVGTLMLSGKVEGVLSFFCYQIRIGAMRQQLAYDMLVSVLLEASVQRRASGFIRRVDIRSLFEQDIHCLHVIEKDSQMQRRLAVLIRDVDLRPVS